MQLRCAAASPGHCSLHCAACTALQHAALLLQHAASLSMQCNTIASAAMQQRSQATALHNSTPAANRIIVSAMQHFCFGSNVDCHMQHCCCSMQHCCQCSAAPSVQQQHELGLQHAALLLQQTESLSMQCSIIAPAAMWIAVFLLHAASLSMQCSTIAVQHHCFSSNAAEKLSHCTAQQHARSKQNHCQCNAALLLWQQCGLPHAALLSMQCSTIGSAAT
jgi:hypothetical protein